MKTAILLALTSSTLAVPFGNVVDAIFGTNMEARHEVHPNHMPSFHPIATGSGTGLPFPTRTGPCPTGTGGHHHHSRTRHGHKTKTKTLAIDYTLAPTVEPTPGVVEKRQAGTQPLPSFTLLDPSDAVPGVPKRSRTRSRGSARPTPTAQPEDPVPTNDPEEPLPTTTDDSPFPEPTTEPEDPEDPESPFPTNTAEPPFPVPSGRPSGRPSAPFPTGGFPSPTGGRPTPTGGIPSRPTTLVTHTRNHPRPTHTHRPRPTPSAQPEFPEFPGDDEETQDPSNGDGPSWMDWLEEMFGHRGNGRSEMEE